MDNLQKSGLTDLGFYDINKKINNHNKLAPDIKYFVGGFYFAKYI